MKMELEAQMTEASKLCDTGPLESARKLYSDLSKTDRQAKEF